MQKGSYEWGEIFIYVTDNSKKISIGTVRTPKEIKSYYARDHLIEGRISEGIMNFLYDLRNNFAHIKKKGKK